MTADTQTRVEVSDFGDAATEYRAACDSAAVFDVSDRTQLEMTGADRHSYLHNFTTNDIKALPSGRVCEAFLCNVKGRILGHVFIFAGDETTWVESVPGQGEFLTSHLERYHLLEDFTLTDRTVDRGELLVTGPESLVRLMAVGIDVGHLTNLSCSSIAVKFEGGQTLDVRRADVFGAPAFLIAADRAGIDVLWTKLTTADVTPAGQDVLQTLRIEAAIPWYGIDLSDENLGQEACRTSQAISFEKGCYLGQEPIARIHAMGHVNRELRRFVIDSDTCPPAGVAILNPNDESKEVGRVTSVGWSWQHNRPIGLGMVRTKFAKPESEVVLATDPRVRASVFADAS
jgi:folate-binding protein YgfZ